MAVTIVLSNQKGGTGKTTSAYVLATLLKERGYKALMVDMDPQGNLSFAVEANMGNATIYDALKEELRPRCMIQKFTLADIIPANILLNNVKLELTGQHREFLLKETLNSLKSLYDYILIDSPPASGILTINASTATDYVLVLMLSNIFSLQEITQLEEAVCRVRNYCNPGAQVLSVFLIKHNPRTRFSKEVEGTLRMIVDDLKMPTLNIFIRESVVLQEAQSLQCSASDYASGYDAVQDYENLLQELIRRGLKVNS